MIAEFFAALLVVLIVLHLVTTGLTALRFRPRRSPLGDKDDLPFVSLIRPVCGIDANDRETLGSSFDQDYPNYEIIFCVASESDPATALVRDLIAAHPDTKARLLVGDDRISANPKLNNVYKGWMASTADWVAMTDSNLMLPRDYLRQLTAERRAGVAAVSAPAVGNGAENLWGAVECAFLNTHQARWQLSADALGFGYAQGKTLFLNRPVIEAGGGLLALGREMAEDLATTRLVRAQGQKVRLTRQLFFQPVGKRSLEAIWNRQLRWSRIRRDGVVGVFSLELLQGFAMPFLILGLLVFNGHAPSWCLAALPVLWYGTEHLLARIANWPHSARDVLAMVLRDAMLPAIWFATFGGRDISWRGTHIAATETRRAD